MDIKKKYVISVTGCFDETIIVKDLTLQEFKIIQEVAQEITKASTYVCMPIMRIEQ